MTHNFMAANNNGAGHLSAPWWKSACSFSEGEEGSAFPEYQQTLVVEADSGAWAALPHVGARPAAPGQRSRSPEELRCAAYAAAARRRFLFGSSPCLPALSRHGNQIEAHPPPQFLISSSLKKADLIPLSSWKWPRQHHWNQYDGAAGVYNSSFYIPNSLTPSMTNQSWWGAEDGADMMDTSSPVPTSHGVFIFHSAADQQQHPPPLVSTVFPAYSSSWENKLGIQNYCYLQQGPLHCSQGGSTLPANFICCLHQPAYLQNQYPSSSPSPYSISHNNSQQQQFSSIEQNGSYLAYEHQFGAVACNNSLLETHFSDITQQHQQSSASLLMGEHNKDAYGRRGSFEGADILCYKGKQQPAIITMKEVQIESILVGNMQEGGNGSSSCALNTQPLVDTTSSAEEGAEGAEGAEGSCQQMHLEPRQLPSASEFSRRQKYHQDVKCRNVQRHQQQIPILFPATGGSSHKKNKKRMCILEKHCTDDSANFDGTKHFLSRSVAPCHCTGTGMPHSLASLKRRATSTQIAGQSQRPVHYKVEMTHSGPFSSKLACALSMVEPLASSAAAFATWHRGAKQLWVAPRARAGANSLHFEQQQQKSSC